MPIAGVVITILADESAEVYRQLQAMPDVTLYGIHKEHYIIAVLEADTTKQLELMANSIRDKIDGVLGVFPSYVHFEGEAGEM